MNDTLHNYIIDELINSAHDQSSGPLFRIITTYKMFNLDDITVKNDNKDWTYRKLIIGPSGSGKTIYLLNSIQKENHIIDKIYLYAKDLEEPKYQLLIKKREQAGIKI